MNRQIYNQISPLVAVGQKFWILPKAATSKKIAIAFGYFTRRFTRKLLPEKVL